MKNFQDSKALLNHAKTLLNKSLKEQVGSSIIEYKGKGQLGQSVEKNFFNYEPNSKQEPDFHSIGIELKCTPIKLIRQKKDSNEFRLKKGYSAKERIVLTMIDYEKIIDESWEKSTVITKIKLLLMFYLFEEKKKFFEYIFILIDLWEPSRDDMKIIKNDWEYIRKVVNDGKAHEISEGDTLYLGACTKGVNALSFRKQPYSHIMAKQRAFSLKQSYVNSIIEELLLRELNVTNGTVSILTHEDNSIENSINRMLSAFIGKNILELCEMFSIKIPSDAIPYQFYNTVIKKILGADEKTSIVELEKSGIKMKTIRVSESGSLPESMSFPAFKFKKIAQEEWEDSELKEQLENQKYLLIILEFIGTNISFKNLKGKRKLESLTFKNLILWNMPMNDIEQKAKPVWVKTVEVIKSGKVYKMKSIGIKRESLFPKSSEFDAMHVRPHGSDANDVDELPNGETFTKQCFWFNKSYLKEIIEKNNG